MRRLKANSASSAAATVIAKKARIRRVLAVFMVAIYTSFTKDRSCVVSIQIRKVEAGFSYR